MAQFQYTYIHQWSLYEKCVVLILKLYEISENIKASASLQRLRRDIFPKLILSRNVYTQNVCNTVHVRHCYPEVLQSLFWTIWKVLTSFFNPSFNQFLAHLLTLSSIPLPSILLFISLMRDRLISAISPSVALLMQWLSRGRTITIRWQWQRSSVRGQMYAGVLDAQ